MKPRKLLLTGSIALALAGFNSGHASVEVQEELSWLQSSQASYYKSLPDVSAYYVRYKKGRKSNIQSLFHSLSQSNDVIINNELDDYNTLMVTAPTDSLQSLSANDDVEFIELVPEHQLMA